MKPCRVCSSIHRDEYERLRLEQNMTYKDLVNIAQSKYNENLQVHHFRKHFNNHVYPHISYAVRKDPYRNIVIKTQIKKDVMIAKQLTENLEICANKIKEKLQKKELTPEEERLLLEFIAEARLTVEELLRWSEKLQLDEKSEDTFTKILECMKDFPIEYIQKFLERWESYGKPSREST